MARYSGARWRGDTVPNETPHAMLGHIGLVLHIQQGTEAGTDSWFHNPAAKVSAHFGNPKSGPLDQWVDTDDRAWAEVAGNPYWVSVENEGNSGDQLTPSQLENVAELLAWLHTIYDVPLQISDNPAAGIPGLTGHGLGGTAWGGHTDCPGRPILDARPQIIARAAAIAGAPTSGGTMAVLDHTDAVTIWAYSHGDAPDVHQTLANAAAWAGGANAKSAEACTKLDQLLARAAVDVDALAAALAPKISAGQSTGMPADQLADLCAHAAVVHLNDVLAAGLKAGGV